MVIDSPETESLEAALAKALEARDARIARCRESLGANPAAKESYGLLLAKLRGLNTSDPARLKSLPKDLAKLLSPLSSDMKALVAVSGASEGLARLIAGQLSLFGLPEEHLVGALLVCAKEEPERTLGSLEGSSLGAQWLVPILRIALSQQPPLDYEDYKKNEILEVSSDTEAPPSRMVAGPGPFRSLRNQHLRKHLLAMLPKGLRDEAAVFGMVLAVLLDRDPFGTLECLREEKLPDPLGHLPLPERMALLERVAARGLGFASTYLDLFGVTGDPDLHPFLQGILCADLTAGSSIYGAFALEGAFRYPFGLGRIEPALPRRISNAEALAFLGKDEPASVLPKSFRPAEVEKVLAELQDQQVRRFLETLKADLARHWKPCYPPRKIETIFGDPELKIRNILYLVAHGTFKENDYFERTFAMLEDQFPQAAQDPAQIALLANRYFFLDLLGLNPALLFASPQKGLTKRSFIEEVRDYQVRAFLHAGMSIHLRLGNTFFKAMPIAWNMLVNQYEGPGQVMQELTLLLETFDTLLTLTGSVVPNAGAWLGPLLDALSQGEADMPDPGLSGLPKAPLRITTKETVERYRDLLNRYCVQMIQSNVKRLGSSATSIVQGLRLPRTRTDKLFGLLEAERQKAKAAPPRR